MYRPITIGRHRYIDGGAHSPTNADVMLDADVDTVIISSPMSARPAATTRRPDHLMRALLHRRLRHETDRLIQAGFDVHVFEPDRATIDTMGINPLDSSRTGRVVRDAFLAAGDQIADSVILRERLWESLGGVHDPVVAGSAREPDASPISTSSS
jgi:NTE family protein